MKEGRLSGAPFFGVFCGWSGAAVGLFGPNADFPLPTDSDRTQDEWSDSLADATVRKVFAKHTASGFPLYFPKFGINR